MSRMVFAEPLQLCKVIIAKTTVWTAALFGNCSKRVSEIISYVFLILLNILTPALKLLCKVSSELPFGKVDSSFALWLHHIWVTSWQVACDFYCINLLLWSFHYFLLFSAVFWSAYISHHDEFCRVMCSKVRGRRVWPTQLGWKKSLPWNPLCCFAWEVTCDWCCSRTVALLCLD